MAAELGQTSDPKALVPGDPGKVHQTQLSMTAYGDLLEEAGKGLARINTGDGWTGQAADQFHEKFHGQPGKWTEAGQAFHSAAAALTTYGGKLTWAQGQAAEAIKLWDQGEAATATAKTEHDKAVEAAKNDAAAKSKNGTPTVPATIPFVDAGEAKRQAARTMLDHARSELNTAGDAADKTVGSARDKAPEKPGFWSNVGDFFSAAGTDILHGVEDLGADVVNAMASLGNAASHHPGDTITMLGGAGLVALGAAGEFAGTALDFSVVLSPFGVALNMASAVPIAAGAGMMGVGMMDMSKHAASDDAVQPMQGSRGGGGGDSTGISSEIDANNRLVKEAERAGRSDQANIDKLTEQLGNGNMNPGTGSKFLFNGVYEARAESGARVYFRNTPSGVQLLGKSTKANQDTVIGMLRQLYG